MPCPLAAMGPSCMQSAAALWEPMTGACAIAILDYAYQLNNGNRKSQRAHPGPQRQLIASCRPSNEAPPWPLMSSTTTPNRHIWEAITSTWLNTSSPGQWPGNQPSTMRGPSRQSIAAPATPHLLPTRRCTSCGIVQATLSTKSAITPLSMWDHGV